jgi:hypothetical protein
MTILILGGVLGGAGVIAAFFRARSSRKERPLHLGVGMAVHQKTLGGKGDR